MITESLQPVTEERQEWEGHWSLSSFGGCPRALLAEARRAR